MASLKCSVSIDPMSLESSLKNQVKRDYYVVDKVSGSIIGGVVFEEDERPVCRSLLVTAQSRIDKKRQNVKQKPLHSSSRSQKPGSLNGEDMLSLFPELDKGLNCGLCSYRATQRGNLKTHYKLKHLGGADLKATCTICQQQFSTKGNLKQHLVKKHNLPHYDTTKLLM